MNKATIYKLRYSKKSKRLRIEVVPGEIRVVAPVGMKISQINGFVASKESWLKEKLSAFASLEPIQPLLPYEHSAEIVVLGEKVLLKDCLNHVDVSGVEIVKWLDGQLTGFLQKKLIKYARQGLNPSKLRLGNARTRWGSCSPKGVIMINRRLVHAPRDVVEYVLVHELVHLKHRNHSNRFWCSVHDCLGDVKPQKKWLRLQGAFLL